MECSIVTHGLHHPGSIPSPNRTRPDRRKSCDPRSHRESSHQSDEIVLLTIFGAVLLVAGAAQRLQVSAAIGAFLVGIAVSGPIAEQTHRLVAPLRDLFAATFFFFFGLQIDPATLPSALPSGILLGVVTAVTKVLTGFWAARRTGVARRARLRRAWPWSRVASSRS